METVTFSDAMRNGRRTPHLWLIKPNSIVEFKGEITPEWGVVIKTTFTKGGMWSGTTYTIALAEGVRAVDVTSPLHGKTFPFNTRLENFRNFKEKNKLNVSFADFDAAMKQSFPNAYARCLETESLLEAMDNKNEDEEPIVVNFELSVSSKKQPFPSGVLLPDGTKIPPVVGATGNGFKVTNVSRIPGVRGGTTVITAVVTSEASDYDFYYD